MKKLKKVESSDNNRLIVALARKFTGITPCPQRSRTALTNLYKLPARFPPLFEALLLNYSWEEIELPGFRLLSNPAGEDLERFESEIFSDDFLSNVLLKNGYVRFGKAPDYNYDPVCFSIRERQKDGDCAVFQLDHEAILCHENISVVTKLAPSFRALIQNLI